MRPARLLAFLIALAVVLPASAADKKKPAVHYITTSPSYLAVDPIYTAIVEDDKPGGLLMVGVGLDVPNKDLRAKAGRAMPVLRDAYVRSLLTFTASSVRSWRQPDVGEIADRLQHVTDRALGRTGAHLLLAQVAMRLSK